MPLTSEVGYFTNHLAMLLYDTGMQDFGGLEVYNGFGSFGGC